MRLAGFEGQPLAHPLWRRLRAWRTGDCRGGKCAVHAFAFDASGLGDFSQSSGFSDAAQGDQEYAGFVFVFDGGSQVLQVLDRAFYVGRLPTLVASAQRSTHFWPTIA